MIYSLVLLLSSVDHPTYYNLVPLMARSHIDPSPLNYDLIPPRSPLMKIMSPLASVSSSPLLPTPYLR